MTDTATDDRPNRAAIIAFLEDALKLAEEVEDSATAYLIERALSRDKALKLPFLEPNFSELWVTAVAH
jgi:hypothetical protein